MPTKRLRTTIKRCPNFEQMTFFKNQDYILRNGAIFLIFTHNLFNMTYFFCWQLKILLYNVVKFFGSRICVCFAKVISQNTFESYCSNLCTRHFQNNNLVIKPCMNWFLFTGVMTCHQDLQTEESHKKCPSPLKIGRHMNHQ